MNPEQHEWAWFDSRDTMDLAELAQACGWAATELEELMEFGALVPLPEFAEGRIFSADCVAPLRAAGKLRLDFDLDLFTVALLLGYLSRIAVLERRLKSLQAQLPIHAQPPGREGPTPWREPRPRQLPTRR